MCKRNEVRIPPSGEESGGGAGWGGAGATNYPLVFIISDGWTWNTEVPKACFAPIMHLTSLKSRMSAIGQSVEEDEKPRNEREIKM